MSDLATRNGGGCLPRLRTFMLLAAAMLPPLGQAQNANVSVPLMLAPDSERQGFVRIINKTDQSGMVRIVAIDDGGTAANPIEIQLAANQSLHFNSDDLADGNAAKGIGSIGRPRQGHWRLSVESALQDVRVLAFVRTRAGFLTAMHDVLPRDGRGRLVAEIINPGSNTTLASRLRLVNAGESSERVSIEGVDDRGANRGPVTLTLGAGQSRTISAFDLENGAQGLTGRLGNGAGKWRLLVTAGQSVVGMSLLETQIGPITNLSTTGVPAAAMTPTQSDDDHGDSFADASPLRYDAPEYGPNGGRIDPAGDVDYFRVRVSESGTLTVFTSGDMDTRGYLYDSNERQLASNDDGGANDGSNFRIQREVDAGTYYVRVEAYYRDATGAYGIHAEFEASTTPPTGDVAYAAVNLSGPRPLGGRPDEGYHFGTYCGVGQGRTRIGSSLVSQSDADARACEGSNCGYPCTIATRLRSGQCYASGELNYIYSPGDNIHWRIVSETLSAPQMRNVFSDLADKAVASCKDLADPRWHSECENQRPEVGSAWFSAGMKLFCYRPNDDRASRNDGWVDVADEY